MFPCCKKRRKWTLHMPKWSPKAPENKQGKMSKAIGQQVWRAAQALSLSQVARDLGEAVSHPGQKQECRGKASWWGDKRAKYGEWQGWSQGWVCAWRVGTAAPRVAGTHFDFSGILRAAHHRLQVGHLTWPSMHLGGFCVARGIGAVYFALGPNAHHDKGS